MIGTKFVVGLKPTHGDNGRIVADFAIRQA